MNTKRKAEVVMINLEKGGVGKTATAITLSSGLHALGYKVLVLDCDSSGGASAASIPMEEIRDGNVKYCLYDIFKGRCSINDAIYHTGTFDIIPTIKDADDADESYLCEERKNLAELFERISANPKVKHPERKMFMMLKDIKAMYDYDFYILDTAPVSGTLLSNELCCADSLLLPCQQNGMSINGLSALMTSFRNEKEAHPDIFHATIDGIVLTFASKSWTDKTYQTNVIKDMCANSGVYLYNTTYRESSGIATSMSRQKSILEYPNCSGLADSINFALEFLHRRNLAPRTIYPGVHQLEDGSWFYGEKPVTSPERKPTTKYYYTFTPVDNKAICEKHKFTAKLLSDPEFTNQLNFKYFLTRDALESFLATNGLTIADENEVKRLRRKLHRQKKA